MQLLLVAALVLALPLTAGAQAAFEVASIRPSAPRTPATYKYTPTGLGQLAEGAKKPSDASNGAAPSLPPDPMSVLNGALRLYGLSLQSRTAPVQVLVVDRANQIPTAN